MVGRLYAFLSGRPNFRAMFVSGGVMSNRLNDSLFFDWCF